MTTQASIGHGSKFQINTGGSSPTWTSVAEVFDISPPNEVLEMVTATNFDSANYTHEFIPGLIDPGETAFEMNFVPGSASEGLILTAKASRAPGEFRVVFPNGAHWTFSGYVTGYEPAVPGEDRMTATVSIKVTGSIVREAGEG